MLCSFKIDKGAIFLGELLKSKSIEFLRQLITEPLDSDDGIHVCVDAPFNRNDNLNITRPGVVRQYFGKDTVTDNHYKDVVHRYSYGVGSGSATSSVGSDPDSITTRRMTQTLEEIGEIVHETVFGDNSQRYKLLNRRKHATPIKESKFNHCTILLYYSIDGVKKVSTMSKHTDCVYDKTGKFMSNLNSQEENTITASYNIGDPRTLNFFIRRVLKVDKCQGREKWVTDRDFTSQFQLNSGDIMIIHPDDERPELCMHRSQHHYLQVLHGDVVVDSNSFSIGMLFRTVKNVQTYKRATNQLLSQKCIRSDSDKGGNVQAGKKTFTRNELNDMHFKIIKKFNDTIDKN